MVAASITPMAGSTPVVHGGYGPHTETCCQARSCPNMAILLRGSDRLARSPSLRGVDRRARRGHDPHWAPSPPAVDGRTAGPRPHRRARRGVVGESPPERPQGARPGSSTRGRRLVRAARLGRPPEAGGGRRRRGRAVLAPPRDRRDRPAEGGGIRREPPLPPVGR